MEFWKKAFWALMTLSALGAVNGLLTWYIAGNANLRETQFNNAYASRQRFWEAVKNPTTDLKDQPKEAQAVIDQLRLSRVGQDSLLITSIGIPTSGKIPGDGSTLYYLLATDQYGKLSTSWLFNLDVKSYLKTGEIDKTFPLETSAKIFADMKRSGVFLWLAMGWMFVGFSGAFGEAVRSQYPYPKALYLGVVFAMAPLGIVLYPVFYLIYLHIWRPFGKKHHLIHD